jgi:hypothetical protein
MNDPLFIPHKSTLPYNGKSKVGYTEAGAEQQEKDDAPGGATGARQAATLSWLTARNRDGSTIRELGQAKGWHHGQASGALSTLAKSGEVVRLRANKRGGQSVYVLPEFIDGREIATPRVNPRVVQAAEPEIRYVEREVPTPVTLPASEAAFVAGVANSVQRNRDRGVLPFKVATMERLLDVIKMLTGTEQQVEK